MDLCTSGLFSLGWVPPLEVRSRLETSFQKTLINLNFTELWRYQSTCKKYNQIKVSRYPIPNHILLKLEQAGGGRGARATSFRFTL
jgi:hypothetical protein